MKIKLINLVFLILVFFYNKNILAENISSNNDQYINFFNSD